MGLLRAAAGAGLDRQCRLVPGRWALRSVIAAASTAHSSWLRQARAFVSIVRAPDHARVGAPRYPFLFNLQPQSMFTINGVLWAMAAEVQFYLLLPALARLTYALSNRTGPLKASVTLVACLTTISFVTSLAGTSLDPGEDRLFLMGLVGPRTRRSP